MTSHFSSGHAAFVWAFADACGNLTTGAAVVAVAARCLGCGLARLASMLASGSMDIPAASFFWIGVRTLALRSRSRSHRFGSYSPILCASSPMPCPRWRSAKISGLILLLAVPVVLHAAGSPNLDAPSTPTTAASPAPANLNQPSSSSQSCFYFRSYSFSIYRQN
jgi:hypothetical protein